MCISPDQVTSEELERNMLRMFEWAEDETQDIGSRKFWKARAERYQRLLKERAEDGTYATAGR